MNIGLNAVKNTNLSTSAITLLDTLFEQAAQAQASDIHFDSFQHHADIRFRIQGALQTIFSPPLHLMPALIGRLKVLAKLNVSEHRKPQEGQLEIQRSTLHSMEARIAILPTLFGEKVTLRLFHHGPLLKLEQLGLCSDQLKICQKKLQCSSGLMVICGPTGAGKTTTLYAFLEYLKQKNNHILCLEQPVERALAGINQVNLYASNPSEYEGILSSALRHDPDVFMIGEIRDSAAALTAIRAAETGHLVLTTLHAGSSYEAILRLLHLGIDQHFLASALSLMIHQRLVPSLEPTALGHRLALFECLEWTPHLKIRLMTESIAQLHHAFTSVPSLYENAQEALRLQKISTEALEIL